MKYTNLPEGAFQAAFEDRILARDIVFVPTWYPEDVLRYYNPVISFMAGDKIIERNEDNQLSVKEDVFELELPVKKDLFYKPTIQVLRSSIH